MDSTKVRLPRRSPHPTLVNPTAEELRALARPEERTTAYGAPSYVTRFRSRSAEGSVTWVYDRDLRLEVPASVPGVPVEALHPRAYYKPDEFQERLAQLRADRRAWLDRFPGLRRDIIEALY